MPTPLGMCSKQERVKPSLVNFVMNVDLFYLFCLSLLYSLYMFAYLLSFML